MLVHSLASKYARFVVLVRPKYWTPPPSDHWTPPLLKSDDLFLGNQEILDPPFENPGHAPGLCKNPGQNPTGQNPTLTKPHRTKPHTDKTPQDKTPH